MAGTGEVGHIRTVHDLRRTVQRLRDKGLTDPDALVAELVRGRSAAELRVLFDMVWSTLSEAGRRRALAEALLAAGREN
jgi:hypothetical protein